MTPLLSIFEDPVLTRVECSCGATTTLRFNGDRYEAENPQWKYRTTREEFKAHKGINGLGWYCGADGHYQKVEGLTS